MSAVVTAIGGNFDMGAARSKPSTSAGGIDQQIFEAEQNLERLRRDLALAQARASQEEQKLAEARRRMEQWRWANAIDTGDPNIARPGAISLATQTHVVDVAMKSNADVSARIEQLQNRIERQIARYFDLQSRRRLGFDEKRNNSIAPTGSETLADRLPAQGVHDELSDASGAARNFPRLRRAGRHYADYIATGDGVSLA